MNLATYSPANDCTGAAGGSANPTTNGVCQNISGPFTQSFETQPVVSIGGICAPDATVTNTPVVQWAEQVVACEPLDPVSCAGGICIDTPADFERCVWRQGANQACPVDYPLVTTVHAGVTDTRDCTCTCAGAQNGVCGVTVTMYDAIGCTAGDELGAGSGCVDTDPGTTYGSLSATLDGTTTATCAANAPSTSGSVTGAEPHTVCCASR